MNRLQVQRDVREAIVVSDKLSRVAHAEAEHAVAGKAAGVRTTLDQLEKQLGRRRVSPLLARDLDRVLGRLVKLCEGMSPAHQANAASLISQAELLRMDVRDRSILFTRPGGEMPRELSRVGFLLVAGVALLAVSLRALSRR